MRIVLNEAPRKAKPGQGVRIKLAVEWASMQELDRTNSVQTVAALNVGTSYNESLLNGIRGQCQQQRGQVGQLQLL